MDCTTRTDTFAIDPAVLAEGGEGGPRPGGWKEARGLAAEAARELLACLAASGCRRRQFAVDGRTGAYVVRWV